MNHSAPPRTVSGTVLLTSPVVLNFEVRPAYHSVYLEYAYHETSGILGLEWTLSVLRPPWKGRALPQCSHRGLSYKWWVFVNKKVNSVLTDGSNVI